GPAAVRKLGTRSVYVGPSMTLQSNDRTTSSRLGHDGRLAAVDDVPEVALDGRDLSTARADERVPVAIESGGLDSDLLQSRTARDTIGAQGEDRRRTACRLVFPGHRGHRYLRQSCLHRTGSRDRARARLRERA